MSVRAIGSGTVSFGLVSIPVKLYSTNVTSSGVSFNLLHKKCKGRLRQQYICPADENMVVEREEMVKGYEFAKGQYVTFTDEEIKALDEVASEAIEITEFVHADQVDAVYFDKAYYLGPDKGGDKAYQLLCAAMRQTGRCALAKYAARGKQYLVMVRPIEGGLVMQQLRYADEVKAFAEVPDIAKVELKEAELKLAVQLIEQISSEKFQPEKYEDDVKKRVLALIQRKIEGEEVTAAPSEAPRGQIIDLMEALKASLGQKREPATAAPAAALQRKPAKPAARSGGTAGKRKATKE